MDANDDKKQVIVLFGYGHPLLTTNKKRDQYQIFESKI